MRPRIVGQHALAQGGIDPLAVAMSLAFVEGDEDALLGQQRRTVSGADRDGHHRLSRALRHRVAVHGAGLGHDHCLVRLEVREWAGVPEAADRRVDEARVRRLQLAVAQTESVGRPGTERLDHHVRSRRELLGHSEIVGVVEVEHDALLAAEVEGRGAHPPHHAAPGGLHGDHLGSQVGQQDGRERRRRVAGEIQHHQPGQRPLLCAHAPPLRPPCSLATVPVRGIPRWVVAVSEDNRTLASAHVAWRTVPSGERRRSVGTTPDPVEGDPRPCAGLRPRPQSD